MRWNGEGCPTQRETVTDRIGSAEVRGGHDGLSSIAISVITPNRSGWCTR